MPILPLVLLAFVTWAIADGAHRLLPAAAALASFEVQSDPGFIIVATVLSSASIGVVVIEWWRRRRSLTARANTDRITARVAACTVLVLLVAWLPAVVQQLTTSPGNLTLWWRASTAHRSPAGPRFGLAVVGKAVGLLPWWAFQHWTTIPVRVGMTVTHGWMISGAMVLLVLVGLFGLACRRGARHVAAGLGVCLAMALGLAVSAATLPTDSNGIHSWWLLLWSGAVGMFVWAIVVCGGFRAGAKFLNEKRSHPVDRILRRRTGRQMRGAAVVAVAAIALPVTIFGQTPNDQQWSYPVIRKTAAAIERLHQRAPYAVGVGFFDYVPLLVGQGLVLQLNSDGVRAGANNGFEDSLGGHYRLPRDGSVPVLVIVSDPNYSGVRENRPAHLKPMLEIPVGLTSRGHRVIVKVYLVPAGSEAARHPYP